MRERSDVAAAIQKSSHDESASVGIDRRRPAQSPSPWQVRGSPSRSQSTFPRTLVAAHPQSISWAKIYDFMAASTLQSNSHRRAQSPFATTTSGQTFHRAPTASRRDCRRLWWLQSHMEPRMDDLGWFSR